ncbi:MAG TPA: hypothetical protein VHA56_12985 [Mucilaginibacter sp.]|nr:hypothetical protein [Mucilaginibacter sp.]
MNEELFSVKELNHTRTEVTSTLIINPHCIILNGHFPGQPVVPGACMLQITKEVLETALNYPVKLRKADHLKFTGMIDPQKTTMLQLAIRYQINDETISVTAKLTDEDRICFKLQGIFLKHTENIK